MKHLQHKRTLANILKSINALHNFIWFFCQATLKLNLNVMSDLGLEFFPGLWTTSLWGYFWCHSGIKQWWAAAFTNCTVLKPTIIIMPEPCEQKQNVKHYQDLVLVVEQFQIKKCDHFFFFDRVHWPSIDNGSNLLTQSASHDGTILIII